MVSEKFLDKVRNKFVHVDFSNNKGDLDWIEGILDFEYDDKDEKFFIEVTSDTDFNRLSEEQIIKIYLKK